jgi:carboxyl-terminal processing protease
MPLDTSTYSNYYGKLVRAGIINQYYLKWVDSHRAQLVKDYPKFDKYNKRFIVTDQMVDELVALAETQKIKCDEKGLAISSIEIKRQLKGLISQAIFTNSQYFEIVNQDNNAFQKAIEILNSWDNYKYLVKE